MIHQVNFDKTHGSPFDRGGADSYYSRLPRPHKGGVGGNTGPRIEASDMSDSEVAAYYAGYLNNEHHGEKKNYD